MNGDLHFFTFQWHNEIIVVNGEKVNIIPKWFRVVSDWASTMSRAYRNEKTYTARLTQCRCGTSRRIPSSRWHVQCRSRNDPKKFRRVETKTTFHKSWKFELHTSFLEIHFLNFKKSVREKKNCYASKIIITSYVTCTSHKTPHEACVSVWGETHTYGCVGKIETLSWDWLSTQNG